MKIMISFRLLSVAFVASFLCTAPPAYAYVTPGEFIDGNGGGTTGDGGGEIGDVPLPTLNPPPQSSSSSSSSSSSESKPAPPAPSWKKDGETAPVLQLLPEERKKWNTREEESMELRMNAVHSAAPEAPHDAAEALPSSGLPFDVLLSGTFFGGVVALHRKKIALLITQSRDS